MYYNVIRRLLYTYIFCVFRSIKRVVKIWNTLFIVIPEVTLNRLAETSYQCNIVVKGTRVYGVAMGGTGMETMLLYMRTK